MNARKRRLLLRAGVLGIALAVALVAWLATRGDDDSSTAGATASTRSRIVAEDELTSVAAAVGHTVYWAGPIAGTELEVIEGAKGNVQIRYRKAGAPRDTPAAKDLVIGSYPFDDPEAATYAFAAKPGSVSHRAPNGRIAVVNEKAPSSVYFTSPDRSVQVEVYDPSPQRALNLALSGQMQPVR